MNRLQLLKRSFYLELPLMCNIVYQKTLQNYQDSHNNLNSGKEHSRHQNAPKNYYTPAASSGLLLPEHHKLLTLPHLKKIHEQLGHTTGSQMIRFNRESKTWDASYNDLIDKHISCCPCSLAAPPLPRLVFTPSIVPERNQTNLLIDVVHLNQNLFLDIIDDGTK